jgi:hypothetical protein
MIDDMRVRNFVPNTQREYIRAILKRSPDTATTEDPRAFQVLRLAPICRHARVAADGFASSRPSSATQHRRIDRRRARSFSGSTRHEHCQRRLPQH